MDKFTKMGNTVVFMRNYRQFGVAREFIPRHEVVGIGLRELRGTRLWRALYFMLKILNFIL